MSRLWGELRAFRVVVSTERRMWGHLGREWVCWKSIDGFVLFLMVSCRHAERVMVWTRSARPISGSELKLQPERSSFCCQWVTAALAAPTDPCVWEGVRKSWSDCSYLRTSVHQSDWTLLHVFVCEAAELLTQKPVNVYERHIGEISRESKCFYCLDERKAAAVLQSLHIWRSHHIQTRCVFP